MTMRRFVALGGSLLSSHFDSRKSYLNLLMRLGTTSEEWFRIEILGAIEPIVGILITGTNHQTQSGSDRPDFTLEVDGAELLVELKVLPKDRNYPYGWQRFSAGKNNKKDFRNLESGVRHGVVYIYWSDLEDWKKCRENIEKNYSVECIQEHVIACASGSVVLSYWGPLAKGVS